jgi:hypothetical protein
MDTTLKDGPVKHLEPLQRKSLRVSPKPGGIVVTEATGLHCTLLGYMQVKPSKVKKPKWYQASGWGTGKFVPYSEKPALRKRAAQIRARENLADTWVSPTPGYAPSQKKEIEIAVTGRACDKARNKGYDIAVPGSIPSYEKPDDNHIEYEPSYLLRSPLTIPMEAPLPQFVTYWELDAQGQFVEKRRVLDELQKKEPRAWTEKVTDFAARQTARFVRRWHPFRNMGQMDDTHVVLVQKKASHVIQPHDCQPDITCRCVPLVYFDVSKSFPEVGEKELTFTDRTPTFDREASMEREFGGLLFSVGPYEQRHDDFGKAFFETSTVRVLPRRKNEKLRSTQLAFRFAETISLLQKSSGAWMLRNRDGKELYVGVLRKGENGMYIREAGTIVINNRKVLNKDELVTELSKEALLAFCEKQARNCRDQALKNLPEWSEEWVKWSSEKMRWETIVFALLMAGEQQAVKPPVEGSKEEKAYWQEVRDKSKRDARWRAWRDAKRLKSESLDDAEPEGPARRKPVRDSVEEPEAWETQEAKDKLNLIDEDDIEWMN